MMTFGIVQYKSVLKDSGLNSLSKPFNSRHRQFVSCQYKELIGAALNPHVQPLLESKIHPTVLINRLNIMFTILYSYGLTARPLGRMTL